MDHPLDRPVWTALTTRLAGLATGDARARRLDPEVGPFGAAADSSPESLAALAALVPTAGLWTVEGSPMPVPPGTAVAKRATCVQMLATAVPAGPVPPHRPLGADDAAEMLALARLTEPGPFAHHTHRYGGYIGVHHEGRLVAMAGERFKAPEFGEVSAVCTHPDWRGRGLASGLMRAVAAAILARGETVFLHAYADNRGAIALYETLGFRIRREVGVTVLVPAG